MALHSVSHNTGVSTDKHTWEKEIVKARGYIATLCPPLSFLSLSAGIPESEIVGFRAPDLKYNDAMLEVLHERGFLYDSSIPTDAQQYPYTLDHGAIEQEWRGHVINQSHPGLWEVAYRRGCHVDPAAHAGGRGGTIGDRPGPQRIQRGNPPTAKAQLR